MSTKIPKKMRNPEQTRRNILEVAFREIYCHGFKGTSTNTIIDDLELTRGAFFHHFPTKDDLGYAIIDEVLSEMIIQRWITPVKGYSDPIAGIERNFARLIDEHQEAHLLCGCPLNNLVQEMADRPEFQSRIQAVMEKWIIETENLLKAARKTGHLNKNIRTHQLAEFIVASQEAAFAMGKALNSRMAMRSILKSLKDYLKHLKAS